MIEQTIEPELIDSRQLATMLSVSKKFIDKHTAAHRLPGMVRVGRLIRFRRLEIEKRLATGELLLPEKL